MGATQPSKKELKALKIDNDILYLKNLMNNLDKSIWEVRDFELEAVLERLHKCDWNQQEDVYLASLKRYLLAIIIADNFVRKFKNADFGKDKNWKLASRKIRLNIS